MTNTKSYALQNCILSNMSCHWIRGTPTLPIYHQDNKSCQLCWHTINFWGAEIWKQPLRIKWTRPHTHRALVSHFPTFPRCLTLRSPKDNLNHRVTWPTWSNHFSSLWLQPFHTKKKGINGAREMVQWLTILVAFAEDQGSGPSIQMEGNNC